MSVYLLTVCRFQTAQRSPLSQYAGALHHVINQGNHRRDLFENVGAAEGVFTDAARARREV
jgi:hypothetical protein